MANLEVIALDTVTPQLRAPGVGDGYVFPRQATFNGNVGIGAAPAQALDVLGIINSAYEFRLANQSFTRVAVVDTGGGWFGGYNVKGNGQPSTQIRRDSIGTDSAIYLDNNGFRVFTDASGAANTVPTERFRVDNLGNVGINTPSPSAQLDVNGAIQSRTGGIFSDAFRSSSGGSTLLTITGGSSGDIAFVTGTTSEVMRLKSGGNITLGDDSATPVAKTLSAQGSRAGTDTNIGGGNLTITPGTGTGTGATSSLMLQSPVAVGSGKGAQTQTTGLTIKNGCAVPRATTVASLPAAASNTDAMLIVTDALTTLALGIGTAVVGGGANRVGVRSDGANWIYSF